MIESFSLIGAVILILILIYSIILHEVAHGYMAYLFGDHTAKSQGRLSLNPIVHADPLGSVIIPGLLVLFGSGILFGWAKPVPYNPYNLKHRYAETLVAAAGVIANILIAILAAIIFHTTSSLGISSVLLSDILSTVIFVNLFLALINLIPIPPLDGSKIITTILPINLRLKLSEKVAKYINVNSIAFLILVLLFIVFFGLDIIANAVNFLTELLLSGA